MYTPLEPFEIIVYYPFFIGGFDFSLTLFGFYLVVVFFTIWFMSRVVIRQLFLIPTTYQWALESYYQFIWSMVTVQTDDKGVVLFPVMFELFAVLATANVFGLLPLAYTVTAQFGLTFALAASFNIGFFLLGLQLYGFEFFYLFVPSGAPKPLLPIIVFIEVASYIIRMFSLSIRLFANMMAGHTLFHILGTFVVKLLQGGGWIPIAFLAPLLLVMAIFVLEFAIALIQAYVFTILLCIYANDAYHPEH